jgi:hypothetical protein
MIDVIEILSVRLGAIFTKAVQSAVQVLKLSM